MFRFPQSPVKSLALGGLLGLAACLAAPAALAVPGFVSGSLYSANQAEVAEVLPSLAADVVILEGGLEQGIQRGMVCRVIRGGSDIAELLIIESTRRRAAALILELNPETSIQSGDLARVKTIQNS